ncbi:MAG: TolC family outer membrane protein [Janthinobacterium lividum]
MTKFKVLLHLSVACILLEGSPVSAANDATFETTLPKNSKARKSKNSKTVVKKNSQTKVVQVAKSVPVKQVDKTPVWLRIDHTRLIHPKRDTNLQLENAHPFNKALVDAYNYNPDIKARLRAYYATSENLSQAIGGWRPTITGQASTGYSLVDDQIGNGQRTRKGTSSSNPKAASVNVTQNLYKGGTTVANTKVAESQIRSARADLQNVEQSTLLKAIQAYTDLWYNRERVKTIQTSENFYKQSLDQARTQADVGESSSTDVAQAESSYEKSVADRSAAQRDAENSRATYVQVTGGEPPLDIKLPRPLDETYEFPKSLEEFIEAVGKYNLLIIKADNDAQAAQYTIDATTGALLPSVDLQGNAGRNLDTNLQRTRQNTVQGLVRLTVPFYNDGGGDWSRLRQVEQTAVQRKYELKSARNQAINDAKQAWENVQTSRDQIKYYDAAVNAGKIGVEGTRQEYMVGERTLLDVLQAESSLVDIKLSALNARRDLIVNLYRLLLLLGELTPEALQLDVQAYDINTYPEAIRNQWIGLQDAPSDSRGLTP